MWGKLRPGCFKYLLAVVCEYPSASNAVRRRYTGWCSSVGGDYVYRGRSKRPKGEAREKPIVTKKKKHTQLIMNEMTNSVTRYQPESSTAKVLSLANRVSNTTHLAQRLPRSSNGARLAQRLESGHTPALLPIYT